MRSMRIAVIGSGYVGTVVAACLAHVGHSVTAVESDPLKLEELAGGRSPSTSPDSEAYLAAGVERGNLRFTSDFGEAMEASDVVFVCVGTPPGEGGRPDMTAMAGVADQIARHLHHRHVFVNKSTVPIGTGNWLGSLVEDLRGDDSTAELCPVVSNPEFLREGSAVDDFLHPDRVVLGSDDPGALEEVAEVYRPIVERSFEGSSPGPEPVPLVRTDLTTAEMTKYAANAFLAMKISYANEIARISDFVGADVTEVMTGIGLDSRIGEKFLRAGIGWGGSCFGKDLSALINTAEDYGYRPELLLATVAVNRDQRHLAVRHLMRELKTLRGARVVLLGLAFKPDTDDLRDAPALDIARMLVDAGAFVHAFDPMVRAVPGQPELRIHDSLEDAVKGADAVVVVTEWAEFVSFDLSTLRSLMGGDVFIDARNAFDPKAVADAGLRYVGFGRPAAPAPVDRIRSS